MKEKALLRAAKTLLAGGYAKILEAELKHSPGTWARDFKTTTPSPCAGSTVANLMVLHGDDRRAAALGGWVISKVDEDGWIPCAWVEPYRGVEVLAQNLILLRSSNVDRPELDRSLNALADSVDLDKGSDKGAVACWPTHDGDKGRLIPVALTCIALSLYQRKDEYEEHIKAMRIYLRDNQDNEIHGAYRQSRTSEVRACGAMTAVCLVARLCSGSVTDDELATSIEFVLDTQRDDGSWVSISEQVGSTDAEQVPVTLDYSAHAWIVRAICMGVDRVSPNLRHRCLSALRKLLKHFVDEYRKDPRRKPTDRFTNLPSSSITKYGQDLATIADLLEVFVNNRTRYRAWRYNVWGDDRDGGILAGDGTAWTQIRDRLLALPAWVREHKVVSAVTSIATILGTTVGLLQYFS
jgi:hypothetical protein